MPLYNRINLNTSRKRRLQLLENIGSGQEETKQKIRKEYLRQMKKLLKTKRCNRNLIKGINTRVVPLEGTQDHSKMDKGNEDNFRKTKEWLIPAANNNIGKERTEGKTNEN